MVLLLSDVLANADLGLQLIDGRDAALSRPVRWVAVTELADPRPFLSGGELVLTTGLRQRSAAAQREFVTRLAECGVVGLGFGTGLTHSVVPAATVAEARESGLPVVEIPYSTPFIAVDQFVASRVLGERYGRYNDLLNEYDALARSLLSGRGLGAMIEALHHILGAPVHVVDHRGQVLAASGAVAGAGVAGSAVAAGGVIVGGAVAAGSPELTMMPVEVEDVVVAYLCCRRPRRSADVLPYAVALVGLELARRQAILAGQRQLAGQVLADVIRATITTAEAERRLATFGVRPGEEHAFLVGSAGAGEPVVGDLRRQLIATPHLPEAVTAVLDDCLVAVLSPGQSVPEAAHLMYIHLSQYGSGARVGIGGWHTGVAGLRWSYYEAYEAMARAPGVNERARMSMSGLLLASGDVPLRDLAEDLLRPLREFDTTHSAALIPTLRAYLDANGSIAAVAEQLIVHRNTVRYRVEQIERLTGLSLTSTAARVQLWLALSAVALTRPGHAAKTFGLSAQPGSFPPSGQVARRRT